jgi:hypothetical protein
LQASPPRNGEIGVAWSIRDDNLDLALPEALKLEYRPNGGAWLPVSINLNANQHYWNPVGAGPWEVRMKARDRAGNIGEGTTTVNANGGPAVGGVVPEPVRKDPPQFGNDRPVSNIPNAPTESQVRYVNKMLVALDYQIKEEGPSGVSKVELWYTEDGRSWNKGGEYEHNKEESKLPFRAAREALYGIALIAKSGVGLGDPPPQVGDRPHLWIEVDTTKPEVQLSQVVVGRGSEKGNLTLQWKAFDKNLTKTPVTISYGKDANGPWTPFAEKIANSGKHTWKMPAEVPYQFFVRVEAIDKAGNVGEAITPDAVKVDLSNPKVNIINVQPATTPP